MGQPVNKSTRHQLHDPRVASLVLCAIKLGVGNSLVNSQLNVTGLPPENNNGPRGTDNTLRAEPKSPQEGEHLAKPEDNIPHLYSLDSPPFDPEVLG